jgi:hypothetical protein
LPPRFIQEPLDVETALGNPAEFTAAVAGSDPIHYAWRHGEVELPNTDSPKLTLAAVTLVDAGTYTVVASNSIGSVTSRPLVLKVVTPPTILNHPQPLTLSLGSSGVLATVAQGTPPLRYRWMKDLVPLPLETGDSVTLPALVDHAGVYQVEVANDYGTVLSRPAAVAIWSAAEAVWDPGQNSVLIRFVAAGPLPFRVESAEALAGPWLPWPESLTPTNGIVQLPLTGPNVSDRFVRVSLGPVQARLQP